MEKAAGPVPQVEKKRVPFLFPSVSLMYGNTDVSASQGCCLSSVHFISSDSQKPSHLFVSSHALISLRSREEHTWETEWGSAKGSLLLSFQENM